MFLFKKSTLLAFSFLMVLNACGGGGTSGSSESSEDNSVPVDITTRFSVPTDLAKISYPDSYTVQTTSQSDVNTNPCNLDLDVVTYPKSWIGNFPLPVVTGAPLKFGIKRAIAIKDIMLHDNPAFILELPSAPNGCTGDLQLELTKTIQRLVLLGVEYVYLPQWHWGATNPDGTWYFVRAEDTFGPVSDADLSFFVHAAHAQGLKVIMHNQIQGMNDNDNRGVYLPPMTMENLGKWFAAYQSFIAERSTFFESIGIDVWEVGCNYCMYAGWRVQTTAEIDLFAQEYMNAIATMSANFSGELMIQAHPWVAQKPNLLNGIDILGVGIFHQPLTSDQADNLSVDSFKAIVTNSGWQQYMSTWDGHGKDMILTAIIQSRANAFTLPGYMEETACTNSIGNLNVSNTTCIQRDTQPDFSLQAIVIEAYMELINDLTLNEDLVVLVGDYWVTDPLATHTAFPNLGTTPRNKPAEGILKMWYAR